MGIINKAFLEKEIFTLEEVLNDIEKAQGSTYINNMSVEEYFKFMIEQGLLERISPTLYRSTDTFSLFAPHNAITDGIDVSSLWELNRLGEMNRTVEELEEDREELRPEDEEGGDEY